MPTLNQNVMMPGGKILAKGRSISAANVKKLELGDHLFDKESKASKPADSSGVDDSDQGSDSDQENQES